MDKINFENLPSTNTPINADNLNDLQDNIDIAKLDKVINVTETGTSCDDYTEDGVYWFGTSDVLPANRPANIYGWLQVLSSNAGVIKQYWHRSSTINGFSEFQTFVRLYNSSAQTWSSWKQYQMVETEDFKSSVTFSESAVTGNCKFLKIGTMVFIIYQGETKTHNQGDLLFTVPAGYEPLIGNVPVTFIKNANAYGTVQLYKANRQCQVGAISSTSASGRIYFSMFYNVE